MVALGRALPGYLLGGGGVLLSLLVASWLRPRRKAGPQGRITRAEDWAAAAGAQAAQQDLLTGLPDRRALEAKLDAEWTRERRPQEPTALLLIGVDCFEGLESASGKLAGDVVLLTLARSLGRMLPRKADLLSRYEGATFAVVLPGTDLPGALRVAARLRWSVVRLGITHPVAESGFASVSLGVAVQHGVVAGGSTPLIQTAQEALFKAQTAGVDRLEYGVLGDEPEKPAAEPRVQAPPATMALPSIRPWVPDQEAWMHTPQS